jgi:hypothetical protein
MVMDSHGTDSHGDPSNFARAERMGDPLVSAMNVTQ